jgi:hypothetical protein
MPTLQPDESRQDQWRGQASRLKSTIDEAALVIALSCAQSKRINR